MATTSTPQRQESDRHQKKTWLTTLVSRPEIGPIGVMLLLFGMLGFFSCFLFSIFFFDIVTSLLFGSTGCLLVAIIGRKLLGFLISGISLSTESMVSLLQNKGSQENPPSRISEDAKNFTQEQG